jgi:hypothetical protein
MANCSSVTPGTKEALDCLKQNLAKLSAPCQTAVSPTMPASPAAAPAAVAAPTPAATPQTPTAAPPKVVKPATAAKPATAPAAKLTPPPSAPPPPPAAAAAPTVAPLTLRAIIMPERRVVITAICSGDAKQLCPGIPPIGPGLLDCLAAKAASSSRNCYDTLKRISRE